MKIENFTTFVIATTIVMLVKSLALPVNSKNAQTLHAKKMVSQENFDVKTTLTFTL